VLKIDTLKRNTKTLSSVFMCGIPLRYHKLKNWECGNQSEPHLYSVLFYIYCVMGLAVSKALIRHYNSICRNSMCLQHIKCVSDRDL